MLYNTNIGKQTSQYNIDNSHTIYTLAAGDEIAVISGNGIDEASNWHENIININGTISASNKGQFAVHVEGSETEINIGASAAVNGYYGIYAYEAQRVQITNNGSITCPSDAVTLHSSNHSSFVNHGTVTGELLVVESDDVSVTLSADSVLKNAAGGTIDVASDPGQTSRIVNRGSIDTTGWAFHGRLGDETFVNRGTMIGGITLGDGDDVFDNRGGTIDHWIYGDGGDDTYIIDKMIDIEESVGGGTDTIRSSVSVDLQGVLLAQDEIENVTLSGLKESGVTGNALANTIIGNNGTNALSGFDGADALKGGRGNDKLAGGHDADMLTGGQGRDIFIFVSGDGHDTVTDFQNGQDKMNVMNWTEIEGFADLKAHHLSVSGDDVVIHAGSDSLILEHTTKAELDASDFIF